MTTITIPKKIAQSGDLIVMESRIEIGDKSGFGRRTGFASRKDPFF